LGGNAIAVKCDHAQDEQVGALMDRIDAENGRLDILVNNATATEAGPSGMGPSFGGLPFWQVPLRTWDQMIDVGLRSHFMTTAMAMPMLHKSKGLVVHVSSAGAVMYYHSVYYGVQKVGTDRMIRDMALEVGPGSVSFLALWPGYVNTDWLR
jgi:NAD(P)-dependent dehydrogenase (short-subunit alcohol dehydrogenase family)